MVTGDSSISHAQHPPHTQGSGSHLLSLQGKPLGVSLERLYHLAEAAASHTVHATLAR